MDKIIPVVNFEDINELAFFDVPNKFLLNHKNNDLPSESYNGTFKRLSNNKIVILFRHGPNLYLAYDKNIFNVNDIIQCIYKSISLTEKGLGVFLKDKSSLELNDTVNLDDFILEDTTMASDEDFNFLLFLNNVLNDSERKSIIFK